MIEITMSVGNTKIIHTADKIILQAGSVKIK